MKSYQIIVGSPVDYQHLVAYIAVDGRSIVMLNQEDGPDRMVIEFFEEAISTEVELKGFLDALLAAQQRLISMGRVE